jgi:hypothetical protein
VEDWATEARVENIELFSGEPILFAGLWNKGVLAGTAGVEALNCDCDKEAPKRPFFGELLRGEFRPGVKSGTPFGFAESWKREPPLWLSRKENLNGDEVGGGRLAGLDMNIESLKSRVFPGGRER